MPAATTRTPPPEPVALRPARREDAPGLARLVDLAGEGPPSFLWARMAASGEDAFAVGVRRAERDEGGFSWRSAVLAELRGAVAGAGATGMIGLSGETEFPHLHFTLRKDGVSIDPYTGAAGAWICGSPNPHIVERGCCTGSHLCADGGLLIAGFSSAPPDTEIP